MARRQGPSTTSPRKDAAIIVVGSSSRGTLGRVLPGAVTDRLLHGAPCPVAVATSGFSGERLRLIGVAFLERPDGRAALAHASRLAEAAEAQVRVLTVHEPVEWRFTSGLEATQLAAMQRAGDEAAARTLDAGLHGIPASRSAGGEVLGGKTQDALAAARRSSTCSCAARAATDPFGPSCWAASRTRSSAMRLARWSSCRRRTPRRTGRGSATAS